MDKVKSILNKVLTWFKTAPIVKAIAVWIVLLLVLAFAVDKLLMPIFSGHFASTGAVPNLEGMNGSKKAATARRSRKASCWYRCLLPDAPQSSGVPSS